MQCKTVLIKIYPLLYNKRVQSLLKIMLVLQNCINLQEAVPGSYSETCLTSHDESQVIDIKVEDAADIQEEEDPLLITSPEIKAEHEVSFMSLCIFRHISQIQLHLNILHFIVL
jgi:hypothetical protein